MTFAVTDADRVMICSQIQMGVDRREKICFSFSIRSTCSIAYLTTSCSILLSGIFILIFEKLNNIHLTASTWKITAVSRPVRPQGPMERATHAVHIKPRPRNCVEAISPLESGHSDIGPVKRGGYVPRLLRGLRCLVSCAPKENGCNAIGNGCECDDP